MSDDGGGTRDGWRAVAGVPLVRILVAPAISLLVIWFAWWGIVTWFHVQSFIACTPAQAFDAVTSNWSSLLSPLVWATVRETVYGLLAGTGCGVVLAVLMSRLRVIELLLYPPIITSQAVPIIALAPILVLIFNYTLTPIVTIVALFVFFPITINTLAALKGVDRDLLDLTRVLGAKRARRFALIEVPAALPGFLSGLRIASVYAVSGAIIGQFYDTSGDSLGHDQYIQFGRLNIPLVYGETMIMTALSLAMFLVVVAIAYLATPWLRRDVAPRWSRAGRTGSTE